LKQVIVVKSTLGTVNETLSDMEHNEVKVRDGLNQIRNYIESVASTAQRATDILSAKITTEIT
jgi:hypothetical protein